MNKIDKRTGEPFPSVQRADAIRALLALPDSRSKGHAKTLQDQQTVELNDSRRDWTLSLDVHSVADLGAFEDHWWYGDHAEEDDLPGARPIEWFERAAEIIQEFITDDDEIWAALNRIFDQAIIEADNELGFAEKGELT